MLDLLEPRMMLSVSLSEGTLLVESFDGTTNLLADAVDGWIHLWVNSEYTSWSLNDVTRMHIRLGAGDDYAKLSGVPVPMLIDAGAGNDSIFGGTADDVILGNDGHDLLQGGFGNDELRGGWGNDTLRGGLGNDTLRGAGDNDDLYGGEGDDLVVGGAGDDRLDGKLGADILQGRDGHDIVDYSSRAANLVIRLDGIANDGEAGENDDVMSDIEEIIAGSGNDLMVGDDGATIFRGGPGNDTIDGGWGNDTLWGGDGFDTGDYSSRSMLQQLRINEGTGVPGEQDIPHDDIECLIGGSGNDWIQGGDNHNLLIGGAGNDTIIGMGGNDTLVGGSGADLLGHDDSGPRAEAGDAGDDVIYTNLIGNNHDGAVDRITEEIGNNVLNYSTEDQDQVLTNWPAEQGVLA